MITSHGAQCDVCGNYILPLDPTERVNFFTVRQIESQSELCCDNKCRKTIEESGGDWQKLPLGPLRKLYAAGSGAK